MLRMDFMASDFNPHFLCLGTAADIAGLAVVLRRFAAAPQEIDLSGHFGTPPRAARLHLVPRDEADGPEVYGVRPGADGVFRLGLNAWQAGAIAERVERLTLEGTKSGSDIFELGAEGEIPLKISHGEFTDDFLVLKR